MPLLAHSAQSASGQKPFVPAQSYAEHVNNVTSLALRNAAEAAAYFAGNRDAFCHTVGAAAECHDLGKLDAANQRVLGSDHDTALPIPHADAGAAYLKNRDSGHAAAIAAMLVYAHHVGLPNVDEERVRADNRGFRDTSALDGSEVGTVASYVDAQLDDYTRLHTSVCALEYAGLLPQCGAYRLKAAQASLLYRMALSCLVDADHGDTARHYGNEPAQEESLLQPSERLAVLDAFVAGLAANKDDARTRIRQEVYAACRAAAPSENMYACGSPVGTGKTTAVMAHLLATAASNNLRRVFVVLPYTNIIDQSVDTYRESLVLPGESPSEIVAAHHHRAVYEAVNARHLAQQWRAPIVVTTAVRFFEVMASAKPAALRCLHCLPGSAIFLDESHAALPWDLWPQSWQWLQQLTDAWGCKVVFGSGSLYRFWQLPEFAEQKSQKGLRDLPDLMPSRVVQQADAQEETRVAYRSARRPMQLQELVDWVPTLPGPRLLIVNTIATAAVIASRMRSKYGEGHVEHLSSALCSRDIAVTLSRVRKRLDDHSDTDWCLVATSCVEAGVDLSFRTGVRERSSLVSLLQAAGRVNREALWQDAEIWDIQLVLEGLMTANPTLDNSARVLGELITEGKISPAYATEAMRRELNCAEIKGRADRIKQAERVQAMKEVASLFQVIDDDTETVVVDKELRARLASGARVGKHDIQQCSVSMRRKVLADSALLCAPGMPEIYLWHLDYDGFIGYMQGVINACAIL